MYAIIVSLFFRGYFMLIFPDAYAKNVYTINYEKLYNRGVRHVIFDVDNTLISYDEDLPNARVFKLIDHIREIGFEVFYVSNNKHRRISRFCENLEGKYMASAKKPYPFIVKSWLRHHTINKENTVIIGDQLMTDVLFSKFLGIRSILVQPVSLKDMWYTKPNRKIENFLLQFDKRLERHSYR